MKKMIVLAACMLLVASAAFAAGISNTKHDLGVGSTSGGYVAAGTSEICVFCHTPHGAGNTVPLWNRNNTTTNFPMYASPTFQATAPTQPTGASLACMGCHDGTLAITTNIVNQPNASAATAGVAAGNVSGDKITGTTSNLGVTLADDHPVSFTFDAALATLDGGLVSPTGANFVFAGGARLIGTKVECASCHDVHNNTNIPFMRGTMARSALCLGCHTK
jgi:predicted CXXCH cytochrome family protein